MSDDERIEPPWPEFGDGIRETVRAVWLAGFQPTDSGDGARQGIKADYGDEALDVPHVFMVCKPCDLLTDARRLFALVESWGKRFVGPAAGPMVQACYLPGDDVAVLELYGALQ